MIKQKTKKQNSRVSRKDYLNSEEIFLINHLKHFNKSVGPEWGLKNV